MQFLAGVAGYVGLLLGSAIGERNRDQQRFRHMAFYDSQTNLLNRNGFVGELRTLLGDKAAKPFAVMTLDLLRLRDYNAKAFSLLGCKSRPPLPAGYPRRPLRHPVAPGHCGFCQRP